MSVKDRLACDFTVIDDQVEAFSAGREDHGLAKMRKFRSDRGCDFRGQIDEVFMMEPWNQKDMTTIHGVDVEKCDAGIVLVNFLRRDSMIDDFAKQTIHR